MIPLHCQSPDIQMDILALPRVIDSALSALLEREQVILRLYFGLDDPPMKLEDIAKQFGLSRERIRQVKEKAIRKLRYYSRSNKLKQYMHVYFRYRDDLILEEYSLEYGLKMISVSDFL